MRRLFSAIILGILLTFAFTSLAAAHNLQVKHPKTGEVTNEVWVGGFTVPADAPPMFGPFNLPPSHNSGLISACNSTSDNSTVTFLAPPFGSCQHGVPPGP